MVVPAHWYYQVTPMDALYDDTSPTDFMGTWIPDGDENTGTTSVMILHRRFDDEGDSTGEAAGLGLPAVGDSQVDSEGRTTTITASGSVVLAAGDSAPWFDLTIDKGDGLPYVGRVYFVDSGIGSQIEVYVSTLEHQDDGIIKEIEGVLDTFEAHEVP